MFIWALHLMFGDGSTTEGRTSAVFILVSALIIYLIPSAFASADGRKKPHAVILFT